MTTNDLWVALNYPDTSNKHMCLGREQEYDRDAADGGLSIIMPDPYAEFLTNCRYCSKPLLWRLVTLGGGEDK